MSGDNYLQRVGELRPNQLLHTYGVGAVTDLPNLSVVVSGLDDWDLSQRRAVVEDRLLAAVQAQLGTQVETLRTPPYTQETTDLFAEWARVGVPVRLFPRWLRCSDTRCNRLALAELWLVPASHRSAAARTSSLRPWLPGQRLHPADRGSRPIHARVRAWAPRRLPVALLRAQRALPPSTVSTRFVWWSRAPPVRPPTSSSGAPATHSVPWHRRSDRTPGNDFLRAGAGTPTWIPSSLAGLRPGPSVSARPTAGSRCGYAYSACRARTTR